MHEIMNYCTLHERMTVFEIIYGLSSLVSRELCLSALPQLIVSITLNHALIIYCNLIKMLKNFYTFKKKFSNLEGCKIYSPFQI